MGRSSAKHLVDTYGGEARIVLLCANVDATIPKPSSETSIAADIEHGEWAKCGTPLVAGFPYLEEEVRWAARHEYAQSAAAVLGQRTRLAFLNTRAAADALPRIVDILSQELGWGSKRIADELEDGWTFLSTFGGGVFLESNTSSTGKTLTNETTVLDESKSWHASKKEVFDVFRY